MRTVPLKECLALEVGETIPQTKGLVKAVFARKTGIGKDGNGSVQNFILAEGGSEIKVTCWDRDDLNPFKGHQVWIMAYKGKGDKLAGVTLKNNSYNKKDGTPVDEKVIEVSKQAVIARQDAQQSLPAVSGVDSSLDEGDPEQQSTPKPASPYKPELGARVGMCMNLAVDVVNNMDISRDTPEFYKAVYEIASDFLRISHQLESGKLAPNVKERKAAKPEDAPPF